MWSVSPRFSWITSTAPFGSDAAANVPKLSRPPGPGNVMSSVADGVGPAGDAPGVVSALGVSSSRAHAASSEPAAAAPRPSAARRFSASRRLMLPVGVIERNLFLQIPVEGHPRHTLPRQARPSTLAAFPLRFDRRADIDPPLLHGFRRVLARVHEADDLAPHLILHAAELVDDRGDRAVRAQFQRDVVGR